MSRGFLAHASSVRRFWLSGTRDLLFSHPDIMVEMDEILDFEWCRGPQPRGDGVSLIPEMWQDIDDIGVLLELTENPASEFFIFQGRRWQLRSGDPYGLRLYSDMDNPGEDMLVRAKCRSQIVLEVRASPVPERQTVRLLVGSIFHFQMHVYSSSLWF